MTIAQDLAKLFPHQPNQQQSLLFQKLEQFIKLQEEQSCFILKGYAGTGKTTIMSTLIKLLPQYKIRSILLAPTGRAAKVLGTYAGKSAFTIHRKIYRKKSAFSPDMHFSLAPNQHQDTIFIIDEASMIADDLSDYSGSSLLNDVIEYVYNHKNNRIIFIGDTAQLPPVGADDSPALQAPKIEKFGLQVLQTELTEVVRQQKESGILFNATGIRELIRTEDSSFPTITTKGFKDVYRMMGDKIIEGLNYAYDKYGMESTLVICRSNKSANMYNQNIRNQILWREDELTGGDLIMVVKNNYFWLGEEKGGFIANGDIGKIVRVKNIHEMYGFRFADVQVLFEDIDQEPLDCKVMLDTLYVESSNLPYERQKVLFEEVMKDYEHLANKRLKMEELKTNPYFNALQIKFSYAVTCHKAQGGQWEAVFIDQGYLTEEMLNIELLRWLYTASTRARKELFYVNFDKQFFPA
ncbi:MAG: AAA family ATPase [Bacteroidetes bacterium]|nr:AAA family ATPase [Bacteroidota bacterium]MBU1371304.1 AAA family ATPase [Bacteroidota bacterium]MBU1485791.1 AAA family ATPase [Bacteroidota bacterium]MBU1759233.1 AAA family ATPase [Bacteroidota bacterium]MBU2267586.1 AAA family ATPase [Bacteroidota bacterium]